MKKQSFITFILALLISMAGVKAFANDIEVKNSDGVTIYYKWIKKKAELSVCYQGSYSTTYSNEYTGNIVIPESVEYNGRIYKVTSIEKYAFEECTIISVTIPKSVTSIDEGIFKGCSDLISIIVDNDNKEYDSRDNCNAIIHTSSNQLVAGCKNTIIPEDVTSIKWNAFSGCSGLTSVTIPSGVTYIGESAFEGCSGLTSIDIPEGVTVIYDSTFKGCSGLTSITIPDGVKYIWEDAFSGCSSLTYVAIPNSVTKIGDDAFYGCSSLTSVHISDIKAWCGIEFTKSVSNPLHYAHHLYLNGEEIRELVIPNSVTSIGNSAFNNCSGLTSVTIPNSVASIGISAFYECSGLNSVTIPNSVTSIGDIAFYKCSGLTSVTFPDGLTSIGKEAFSECSGLTSATFPDGLTSIGSKAFFECSGLTSVTLPDGLKTIGSSAFENCTGLTSVSIGSDNGSSSSVIMPLPPGSSTSYYANGTTIGSSAFSGCSNISSVTIGKSVTRIEHHAFNGCSIETVTIPSTMQYIGGYAFGSNLKSIYTSDLGWLLGMSFDLYDSKIQDTRYPLLAGVEHLFVDGEEVVDLELEDKRIGNYVFYGYRRLKTLKIKGSFSSLGKGCFACCPLESVEISEGVTSIPENAFEGCSNLMSIKIPSTVTSIGKDAFYRTGIYNSQADDGIYYVDNWVCGYKGNADENTVVNVRDGTIGISNIPAVGCLNIPASVKYMSSIPMKNVKTLIIDSQSCLEGLSFTSYPKAEKLETLILGNAISTIPKEKFKNLSNLKTVLFGYGLREIKSGAFIGCEGLEKIRIPNGVTTIESDAFYSCKGLTTLTIPGSVTSIGSYAFGNCMSLVSVNSLINVPKVISENVFGCSESGYDAKTIYYISTLYVPRGRTTIYNNVSSWNLFSNIQEKDIAYELTYVLDNEIYKTMEIQEGITVTPETDPVKYGYVFSGWKTVPETMPASDVIVFGEFRPYKKVEIADIVNCVFGRSGITYNEDFDTNHDGKVDVADIVTAIKQRK